VARTALVSGGNRGIGGAISRALARDGANVAILYRRDDGSAAETVQAIEQAVRKGRAYKVDVQDAKALESTVSSVVTEFGAIDILVNSAGIASRGNLVSDTDPEEMQRVVAVHAFGPFFLSRLVVPVMRQQARGDIIFISSTATLHMGARGAPYNMGKAAMEALARTLAKEERPNGIRVNVVAPGLVETEMGRRLVRATTGAEIAEISAGLPFGRACQPEDIAETVAFLCSERSQYTTGQVVYVNGGADGGGQEWSREK
jgi:3-oxoacyl-[acyl-carrier protein] reductase